MNISQRLRTCAKHTGLDSVIELLQEAADEIDRLSGGQQAEAKTDEPVPTIDLDLLAWESIKKAAVESPWIPPQYYQNDWVRDVCSFLREPAPGVMDDVVRDAERYRWLRASTFPKADQYQYRISTKPIRLPIGFDDQSTFDAAIDAAKLTATQAQKGHQ